MRAKDGRLMDLEMRFAPVRGESQQVVGLLALGRDVTEHKRSERDLRRHWDQVVESAVEGIVVMNEAGRIEAGIPDAVRERLYTPFVTTKSRGAGLGLLIARRFVEAHGGRMDIESPHEGGTVVRLRLPLSEPGASA